MKNIIGRLVRVHLKEDDTLDGVLIGVEHRHIYLQVEADMFVIPQENVKYYQTQSEEEQSPEPEIKESAIKVSIDGEFLTKIIVPPTMNLASASEEVLRTVWANLDVQSALRGKVQRTLEYSPGEVNIILAESLNAQTETTSAQNDVAFSMGGGTGNPISSYLSPSEMVSRLQNAGKKEKKNE